MVDVPFGLTLPPIGVAQVGHAARILAACALAYGVSLLLGLPEGYWSLITVVIVTQPDLPRTVSASRDRVIGTLLGAAVGALAIAGRMHGLPALPLYAAGLVPLAFLTAIWPTLRLSCITLTIVFLAPATLTFTGPVYRVTEIVLGILAALLVTLVPVPRIGRG